MRRSRRYRFDEVHRALAEHWGYAIERGQHSEDRLSHRDGRWDVTHSRTGYIVSGQFPGYGHRHIRFRSLADVVRRCDLAEALAKTVQGKRGA